MPFTIIIIEEKEKLYAEIHQSYKNTVDTNYALFQTSK